MNNVIKFIHLSDIHIGFETHGRINTATGRNTRLEDVLNSLDFIVDTAIRESVDLVLIAGDVFHRENPHPTEETEFAKRIVRLVKDAGASVVIALGNHDYSGSFGRAAAVEIFPAISFDTVFVARKPHIYSIETKSGVVQVACLPWSGRGGLIAKEEFKELSQDQLAIEIEKRLTGIIGELIDKVDTTYPAVFLGHLHLRDAKLSGTEMSALQTFEPTVSKNEFLRPELSYVAVGHVHKFQNLNASSEPPIIYSGSIERIDFSEEEEKKGFVLGELFKGSDGWECKFEFVETPARKFVTIDVTESEGDANDAILSSIEKENVKDAIVRVRYKVSKSEQQADEKKIRSALSEAHSVKIERIFENPSKTRRQSELSKATDVMEALDKYIHSKPDLKDISEDMKKYAKDLLDDLEKS